MKALVRQAKLRRQSFYLMTTDTGGVSGGEAQSESMTSQGAETAQTEAAPDESTESVVAAS